MVTFSGASEVDPVLETLAFISFSSLFECREAAGQAASELPAHHEPGTACGERLGSR